MMWSDTWKEHYKGTQWEGALNHYAKNIYEGFKSRFNAEDYAGALQFLSDNLVHERTNKIHNNVSIGRTQINSNSNNYSNYSGSEGTISAEDKALFVDFDSKDFTLTKEGLAKIQKTAPEFKEIPFNEIGLKTNVGGNKPVVTVNPGLISGVAAAGNEIEVSYTFADQDGDLEGNTKIYWYAGDTADGKFEQIYGVEGDNFKVTEEYNGRYLKYEIIPYDTQVLRGEAVMSAPISVTPSTRPPLVNSLPSSDSFAPAM